MRKIVLMVLLIGTKSLTIGQKIWTPQWDSPNLWRYEIQDILKSSMTIRPDTLELISYGGATIWLDTLLKGDYVISYDRKVCQDTGIYDRVSDLNQFWLTSEVDRREKLRVRNGAFEAYNDLELFYFGIGGNYNTTTRFRRYNGQGERIILDEKNQGKYLLQPNVFYNIKTVVSFSERYTAVYVNDELWFLFEGEVPEVGYFGIRLTYARQQITNMRIINK